VLGTSVQKAEIYFRYLGPSVTFEPLASGELRQQIGLKLKAQDTCNLLYVMWHMAPNQGLGISVKRNPGQATHAQCGANGYINLKPSKSSVLPVLDAGEEHILRAEFADSFLTVYADKILVWAGSLGESVANLDRPVGRCTDNA